MGYLFIFFLSLVAIHLLRWFLKRREIFRTFEKLGIPYIKPSFWTGTLSQSLQKEENEIKSIQTYGSYYGFFLGTTPVLTISDPELMKIIQVKEAQTFYKRNVFILNAGVPGHYFEESSVIIHGPRWKQSRDTITPGYTTSKLKTVTPYINKIIDENWKAVSKFAADGKPVDISKIYSILLTDMTFQIAFGVKINKNRDETLEKLANSLALAFSTSVYNPINFIAFCFPELHRFVIFLRNLADFIKSKLNLPSITGVAALCSEAILARLSLNKNNYPDVLQQMMNVIYLKKKNIPKPSDDENYLMPSLTPVDCVANSVYIAAASYDTVRSAIIFGTYLIATHRDVQEKMREEINQYKDDDGNISYSSYAEMTYLDNVYSEVLRLFPPVPDFLIRIASKDFQYKDLFIPKGMNIFIPQVGLNKNSDIWPEPEKFIPERFADKSKIDPYIYQPFGIGPRHCTGMRIAQLTGKLILARIVQNFDIRLADPTRELKADYGMVINHPNEPLYLIAKPI